jgi:hypothetical protein
MVKVKVTKSDEKRSYVRPRSWPRTAASATAQSPLRRDLCAVSVVTNALVDALSVLGIKHVEMLATPEVLWKAIHAARGKS